MQDRIHSSIDARDTSRCPLEPVCETCQSTDDLAVLVVPAIVGPACATLCLLPGAEAGASPRWPVLSSAWCVAEHLMHLHADDPSLLAREAVAR